MRSIINSITLLVCCLICCLAVKAQEINRDSQTTFPDKVFTADLYAQFAIPSGDNFIGNGLSSGTGFGLRLQYYLHKGIYAGGALTQDFFKVDDTAVIGEFNRATKFNAYLFAGYDYSLNEYWNITADLGYGYSQNKNRQSTFQGGGKFRDSGNVFRISTSLEYTLSSGIGVYVSPSYETVAYDIEASAQSGDIFEKGNYFNVALGIRLNSRKYNQVPLRESENQQLLDLQNRDRNDLTIKEKRALYFLKKRQLRKTRRERRKQ